MQAHNSRNHLISLFVKQCDCAEYIYFEFTYNLMFINKPDVVMEGIRLCHMPLISIRNFTFSTQPTVFNVIFKYSKSAVKSVNICEQRFNLNNISWTYWWYPPRLDIQSFFKDSLQVHSCNFLKNYFVTNLPLITNTDLKPRESIRAYVAKTQSRIANLHRIRRMCIGNMQICYPFWTPTQIHFHSLPHFSLCPPNGTKCQCTKVFLN